MPQESVYAEDKSLAAIVLKIAIFVVRTTKQKQLNK